MPYRAGALALALATAVGCTRPEPPPPRAVTHEDLVLEPDSEVIPAQVPANTTLTAMLKPYGLHEADTTAIVGAISRVFDVRRLHAGQPWRIERTHAGDVRFLEYKVDPRALRACRSGRKRSAHVHGHAQRV